MKQIKKATIISILIATIFTLSACGKKENSNSIVGKWAYSDSFIYTFNKDKTCSYDAMGTLMKCTYTVDGDKLSIMYEGDTEPFETTFKIEDNVLTIKDSLDNDVNYKRK